MKVLIRDTTGTQTDSIAPLSRKKLKQLMRQNRNLTSGFMQKKFGRKPGKKFWSKLAQKREERKKLRRLFASHTLEDGTKVQLIPKPEEIKAMRPTIFERLGGMFSNMTKRFERATAKGKG